mgnify:CR=1 FL=1
MTRRSRREPIHRPSWSPPPGETIVGLLLISAAVLLLFGRDRKGVAALRAGVIFGLAAVNVVLGYVDAELVLTVVLFELVGLGLAQRYRTRFLGQPRQPDTGYAADNSRPANSARVSDNQNDGRRQSNKW